MMMTSKFEGPTEDEKAEPTSESPTFPGIRKARVTASAVTMRELPAAMDTVPLPPTRGAGFRAPEEGGSDRPFDIVRPARAVNPRAPTLPAPAAPRSKSSPMEKATSPANKRKR